MTAIAQESSLVSLILEKYGIRAPAVALHEALKARGSGDAKRAETWAEVARLAEYALRTDPV